MRDSVLIFDNARKNIRKELKDLWQPRKNNSAHYPPKKEKPRGNGASSGDKQ